MYNKTMVQWFVTMFKDVDESINDFSRYAVYPQRVGQNNFHSKLVPLAVRFQMFYQEKISAVFKSVDEATRDAVLSLQSDDAHCQ